MGCRSIIAVAVVAAGLLGADASPCKPGTSAAVSVIESEVLSTVASETTSAVLVETSLTLSTEATSDALTETTSTAEALSSSLLETTLTTLVETTSTTLVESTSTELVETTPTTDATTFTTLAASTTTTEAETCIETQAVINPGFDDDTSGDPWVFDGNIVGYNAYSTPNAMEITVINGMSDVTISQNLYNLNGKYRLSYRFKVASMCRGTDFTCSFRPKMGSSFISSDSTSELTDVYHEGTAEWSTPEGGVGNIELKLVTGCYGNFMFVDIQFDDITLTKVCDVDLKPSIA